MTTEIAEPEVVEAPKPKTLLEELQELDDYLLDRRDRTARSESAEMAYENSARLLRAIVKRHSNPKIEWGIRYTDQTGQHHSEWGLVSDPRTNGAIDVDGEYQIAKRDWREVVAVGQRVATEEKWEEYTRDEQ